MVVFTVPGTPIPQGSKKAFRAGTRINLVEANPRLKLWRSAVADKANLVNEFGILFSKPISLDLVFVMPRPGKPKFLLPAVKPDLDKLIRAVNDSLTGTLIRDDSLVCIIHAEKRYETEHVKPGVTITITDAI